MTTRRKDVAEVHGDMWQVVGGEEWAEAQLMARYSTASMQPENIGVSNMLLPILTRTSDYSRWIGYSGSRCSVVIVEP